MRQIMTGDNWGDVVRDLYISTGQPGAVNTFFVSYVVSMAALRDSRKQKHYATPLYRCSAYTW